MPRRLPALAAFAFLATGLPLFGAKAPAPTSAQPTVITVTAQQRRDAIIASKALFKSGDFTNGEAALFAANRHAEGTAEGHRDSGSALITLACMFRQDGDGITATKLAKLALGELEKARSTVSNDNKLAAEILTRIGFVHERLYGTRAQAEASYAAAVRLSPAAAKIAAAALSRMQAADNFRALKAKKLAGNEPKGTP